MKAKIVTGIFFAMLILPTISFPFISPYIDTENNENRALAEMPEFSFDTIDEYPDQLEDYYLDHLPYKNQLKNGQSHIDQSLKPMRASYELLHDSDRVVVGKDSWMYFLISDPGENSLGDYLGTNLYTEEELQNIADNYQQTTDYFSGKGMDYYLLTVPSKEHVVPEYMPDNYEALREGENRLDLAIEYLRSHTSTNIVYALEDADQVENKQDLYYKYDTHWNQIGAFLGAEALNEMIQGERMELDELTYDDITADNQDLAKLLGWSNYTEPSKVITNYHTDVQREIAEASDDRLFIRTTSTAKDQRTLLLYGDSFRNSMFRYMSFSYGEVICTDDIEKAKEYIDSGEVDIVVHLIAERFDTRFQEECINFIS